MSPDVKRSRVPRKAPKSIGFHCTETLMRRNVRNLYSSLARVTPALHFQHNKHVFEQLSHQHHRLLLPDHAFEAEYCSEALFLESRTRTSPHIRQYLRKTIYSDTQPQANAFCKRRGPTVSLAPVAGRMLEAEATVAGCCLLIARKITHLEWDHSTQKRFLV